MHEKKELDPAPSEAGVTEYGRLSETLYVTQRRGPALVIALLKRTSKNVNGFLVGNGGDDATWRRSRLDDPVICITLGGVRTAPSRIRKLTARVICEVFIAMELGSKVCKRCDRWRSASNPSLAESFPKRRGRA